MRIVRGLIVALFAVCVGVAGLTAEDAPADGPVTISFTTSGTHSFTVPAGITSIHVVAIGGHGGSSEAVAGGQGAEASANLSVTPGEVLNVHVGGNGANYVENGPPNGGSNGGGNSVSNGGGGGASDVRTSSDDLSSRLIVAGGGGGGGSPGFGHPPQSSPGADAGQDAAGISPYCGGGKAGTTEHGGEGGPGNAEGSPGQPGKLGSGGDAAFAGGGGGGAGWYGGGSGGGSIDNFGTNGSAFCGGGGGASGFGAGTSGTSISLAGSSPPSVTITYGATATTPGGGGAGGGSTGGGSTGGGSTGGGSGGGGQTGGGGQRATANLSVAGVQHGKSVIGTVRVPADRSFLKAKLLWRASKGSPPLVFGKLVDGPLKRGLHTFTVALNGRGKGKLAALGSLKLSLAVVITPPQGAVATAAKNVTLKP